MKTLIKNKKNIKKTLIKAQTINNDNKDKIKQMFLIKNVKINDRREEFLNINSG